MDKIESHSPDQGGALAEFRLNIQSLAEDFRKLARNRTNDEREHIFTWHIARPYTQLYLAGGRRYVQEEAYPQLRRRPGWDELRSSRHVQHIRALAAYAWMRDAGLDLPFVLEPWVTRQEFVEDLEFQFLELLEKLEPPALQMVPAETPPRPQSPPTEPAPTNADQVPISQETPPGPPSEASREVPQENPPTPPLEASREEPPEASWFGSLEPDLYASEVPEPPESSSPGLGEPDLSTPEARRAFVFQFKAECKELVTRNVSMGDLALIAEYTTRYRRFAVYEWIARGGKGRIYRMLMAGPARAAEFLKSPKSERIRAMTRSAEAVPEV